MSKLKLQITMSLDGFVAGPDQGEEHPLGRGGMRLHDWAVELESFNRAHGRSGGEVNASSRIVDEMFDNVGAAIMGRNMFGPVRGPWGEEWRGWWGDNPPFHMPVYVLTHHEREPLEMEGGTTFHFVTDGVDSALEQARATAGDKDVLVAGGASALQQYLAAGLVDEMVISVVPLLLGDGERLFDNLGASPPALEQIEAIPAPGVTHIRYRVS